MPANGEFGVHAVLEHGEAFGLQPSHVRIQRGQVQVGDRVVAPLGEGSAQVGGRRRRVAGARGPAAEIRLGQKHQHVKVVVVDM